MALYIRNDASGASIAKFGSWDKQAIHAGEDLMMFESFESDSWGLKANQVLFNGVSVINIA